MARTYALIRILAHIAAPLSVALVPMIAHAQTTEELAAIVEPEAESGAFMGAALVARGNEVILDAAWGEANLEWNIANTTDTKFRIGSVTKQFTAVSLLLLQERGALALDDPLSKHYPEAPEAWGAITLRNLLRHTSGIPNVTDLPAFAKISRTPISQDDLIGLFRDLPLEFEPGSKWSYSNSGYVVLSRVIENASGQSYSEFVEANLFDAIGMEATAVDVTARIVPKRAAGYSPSQEGRINAPYADMGIPTGAGALYSTTGDLLKWQRAVFGGQVLSQESLDEYLTPTSQPAFREFKYAHGITVGKTENGTIYWHGGGIEGFNSWLGHDADREVTVVVLANLNGASADELGMQLMTLAQGGTITQPGERKTVEVDPAILPQYEGVYALSPAFKITVTHEKSRLFAQATGQDRFELYPESKDRFFLKVVDAQIRFDRGADGAVSGLTLFQNGVKQAAAKE
ncbi:MAG: serine hydrolase [Pseudomonadota bacterium]